MKRVAVLGWFNHGNFGDELILAGVKQLFRDWQVYVVPDYAFPKLDYKAINNCDLFVLGGGELIHPHSLYSKTSMWYKHWIRNVTVPKMVLGCGVNADDATQVNRKVAEDLKEFSYIGLRDSASVKMLKTFPRLKSKVHLTHDLAFSAPVEDAEPEAKGNIAVVVPTDRATRRFDNGITETNLADHTRKWLTQQLSGYSASMFLPFGVEDNNDEATCKALAGCAVNSFVWRRYQVNLRDVAKLIRQAQVTVAYRLHGLILSFMLGVPYAFYPYHHKLTRTHETLKDYTVDEVRVQQRVRSKEALKLTL